MKTILILLFLYSVTFAQQNEVDINKLKRAYKAQLITGGVTLSGAVGCVAGFAIFRHKSLTEFNNYNNNYLREARVFLVFGAALTGISIYSFVKGSKNRKKYYSLTGTGEGLSLLVRF